MIFPVVVFKGQRHLRNPKFFGGVLNPEKAYYVYRTEGNKNPLAQLLNMAKKIDERNNHGNPA